MWCIPRVDDEFKRRMHEILDLYEKPYDAQLPVVCLDEKLVELRSDAREGYHAEGGYRRDYEYQRHGTANVFMITDPKGGRHWARVTARRTKRDFAHAMAFLAARYPSVITIHLVMDNLNTHTEASLIETFGVERGRRLWARFSVHYTPKHASWLDQAEIALAVTTRCCLGKRRFATIDALRHTLVRFWAARRKLRWKIDWKWTATDAKKWLKTLKSRH